MVVGGYRRSTCNDSVVHQLIIRRRIQSEADKLHSLIWRCCQAFSCAHSGVLLSQRVPESITEQARRGRCEVAHSSPQPDDRGVCGLASPRRDIGRLTRQVASEAERYLYASGKRNSALSANSRSTVDDYPLCAFQTVS
jgi:hypothetical protein